MWRPRKIKVGNSEVRKMKKTYIGKIVCGAMACLCLVSGCAKDNGQKNLQEESLEAQKAGTEGKEEGLGAQKAGTEGKEEGLGAQKGGQPEANQEGSNVSHEPEILETDWSEYFDGLVGAAVLYDPSNMRYSIFQPELALTQRPPCSTFKIIASLIALEQGVIEPEDSTRAWSGEVFWNEKWNHDIDFHEAFRESCVWYFREVIDEIGKEQIQQGLNKLQYGNCDSSDWEGRLNTNNNNRALTGFWLESSLKISPKEQTEVMERIFGSDSVYSQETREKLKEVMLVDGQGSQDISIYGKTGMGMADGVVVDAWFTGFAEHAQGNLYFCAYLGRSEGREVSSAVAKEIAIRLVQDYLLPQQP